MAADLGGRFAGRDEAIWLCVQKDGERDEEVEKDE